MTTSILGMEQPLHALTPVGGRRTNAGGVVRGHPDGPGTRDPFETIGVARHLFCHLVGDESANGPPGQAEATGKLGHRRTRTDTLKPIDRNVGAPDPPWQRLRVQALGFVPLGSTA
jgi:hypothetical protein